jgi:hypothetical protein
MKRSKGERRRRWGQRWSEEQAREFLLAWRESAQPLPDYCRRQGVEYERVRRWRSKLDSVRGTVSEPLTLKAVRVVAEEPAEISAEGPAMEVALAGGRRIRVQPGFDAETLVRLVSALERA